MSTTTTPDSATFQDLLIIRATVARPQVPEWVNTLYHAYRASGIKANIKNELVSSFSRIGDMQERWNEANSWHLDAIQAGIQRDGMADEPYPSGLCFYQTNPRAIQPATEEG